MVEASPKPINYWARESGKSNPSRLTSIAYTHLWYNIIKPSLALSLRLLPPRVNDQVVAHRTQQHKSQLLDGRVGKRFASGSTTGLRAIVASDPINHSLLSEWLTWHSHRLLPFRLFSAIIRWWCKTEIRLFAASCVALLPGPHTPIAHLSINSSFLFPLDLSPSVIFARWKNPGFLTWISMTRIVALWAALNKFSIHQLSSSPLWCLFEFPSSRLFLFGGDRFDQSVPRHFAAPTSKRVDETIPLSLSLCSAHSGILWGSIMSSHQSSSLSLSLLDVWARSQWSQRRREEIKWLSVVTQPLAVPRYTLDCLFTPIWQREKETIFLFLPFVIFVFDRAKRNREKCQSATIPIEICASESCRALTAVDSCCSLSWRCVWLECRRREESIGWCNCFPSSVIY